MAKKRKPIVIDALPIITPQENEQVARQDVKQSLGALTSSLGHYGWAFIVLAAFGLLAYFSEGDEE